MHGGRCLTGAQAATSSSSSSSCAAAPRRTRVHQRRAAHVARAKDSIGEDVLARLRAAEEEATRLRKELATVQAASGLADPTVVAKPRKRIDGTDAREGMLSSGSTRSAWLSENETAAVEDPEMAATVQRRLIVGAALAAGLAAFALVPTESLVIKPSRPMFSYLVPVLRIQQLLADTKEVVDDANWEQLRLILSRISGNPNNARENVGAVIALLGDAKTSEKARAIANEFYEFLASADYDKYFDTMVSRNRVISGVQNAQFVDFSNRSLLAAQQRLAAFLALVPSDQLEAARVQIEAIYAASSPPAPEPSAGEQS